MSKENEKIVNIYIYEISPIPVINISEDMQKTITNSYTTFLREINVDFQILVINKKLNIQNIFNNQNTNCGKYDKYLQDMRVKIKEDNIFYTKYYMVVALNKQDNIEDIDKSINLLKNCGCDVTRLDNKKEIEDMLYECINKEDLSAL